MSTTTEATSKVKEYIDRVKVSDKVHRKCRHVTGTTLEDLYGIDEQISQSSSKARTDLRKSLRELKEKDLLILKLREACHDLTIKYADAENTIDELRFATLGGYGSRTGKSGGRMMKSSSAFCLAGAGAGAGASSSKEKLETRDQGTGTSPIRKSLKNFPATSNDSCSSFDILDESCSNWMEKVQNWKTGESMFNTSADADSGFRGSDINGMVEGGATGASQSHTFLQPNIPPPTTNSSSGGCSRKHGTSTSLVKYVSGKNISSLESKSKSKQSFANANANPNKTVSIGTNTEERLIPLELELLPTPPCSAADTVVEVVFQNQNHDPNPIKPAPVFRLKSQSYTDLNLFQDDHTKPEGAVVPNRNHYSKRLSMSNAGSRHSSQYYNTTTEFFKTLDPLLDDATQLAKRVQRKSQKLARQLQQTLNESRRK